MTTYYPAVCYSSLAVNKLQNILEVDCPARTIMRYNTNSGNLVQTKMTLFILSPDDHQRLREKHLFDKYAKEKRVVELGEYLIRENRMPKKHQTGNLYIRFDKKKELSHKQVESTLNEWLLELQNAGVIDHFNLQIPVQDREGDGKHKGYGFIRFTDGQEMKDRCVTFAMLQNRRLSNANNVFLSVVWAEKNKGSSPSSGSPRSSDATPSPTLPSDETSATE